MPGREGAPPTQWEYTLSTEPPPRHDDSSHYPIWTAMFQEREDSLTTRIQYFTVAYVVTGEARYFEKAKEIVLALCAWPGIWTDPSYGGGKPCLDTGHAATWVGIFYDWCHAALTEAERRTVREALITKALAPIDGMIDGIAAYHNFTAVIGSGLSIGAIALLGEEERAQKWSEHGVARAKMNFDLQGKDGGAMEGPMYGTYAADCFADLIWALTTAGIPNPLVEHNYLKTLPRYCISLLNPNNFEQPCFGDGGPGAGFGRLMLALALRGDAGAAWYCEKAGQFAAATPRNLLALDPARLHPKQPAGSPSDAFVDVGYAILRDGYQKGSAFLAFKAGPPADEIGHNHFDHNSFVINYDGTWIAWDPGYRSYFNPPERRYTTGTLGHNSIVLDLDDAYLKSQAASTPGRDQVRLTGARIAAFSRGDAFDYVLGAAADSYNTKEQRVLDRFDRQILFAKPGVFFIRDALAAPAEHTYSFLLHLAAGGDFAIAGDQVKATGPQCYLQTHVFSPAGITLSAATYPGAENRGPYLAATTGKAKAATITTVLVPRKHSELLMNAGFEKGTAGWSPRTVPGFIEHHVIDRDVKHGGAASGRIDEGGYYYSAHFPLPAGTKMTVRYWAKATAEGANSRLYFWRGGAAFANQPGPTPAGGEWKRYEFTAVVPEKTDDICLALEYWGKGRAWYDDVEILTDRTSPAATPAQVTPLAGGAEGAVAVVDGVTYLFLCGTAGQMRTVTAAGHQVTTDAEIAAVTLKPAGPEGFLLRGKRLEVDGKAVRAAVAE